MITASLSPATGPLLVAAVLLLAAGTAKLRRPAPSGLALAQVGLPGSDPLVRVLGATEIVLAGAAVVLGGVAAAAVAATYIAFAAFVGRQLVLSRRAGAAADCGCFGDLDAPVGPGHVVVDLLLALGAAWAASSGAGGPDMLDAPRALLAVAGLSLVGAFGVRALLTDLPRLRAVMTPGVAS